MTMVWALRLWQQFSSSAAYAKFSEMQCPEMKPDWSPWTNRGMYFFHSVFEYFGDGLDVAVL
jgi:hypothetical protein